MNDLARKVQAYLNAHRHHDGMNVVLTLADCDELVTMVAEPPAFIECDNCHGTKALLTTVTLIGDDGDEEAHREVRPCLRCGGKGFVPFTPPKTWTTAKDLNDEQ